MKILIQGEMVRCVKPKLRDSAWKEVQVGEQICAREEKEWNCQHSVCPTLCNPMDCSLPISSVHRIFQTRILERVTFSRGSSRPKDRTPVSCISCLAGGFFTAEPPAKTFVPSSFSVFYCSRRKHLSRRKHCSKRSQVLVFSS